MLRLDVGSQSFQVSLSCGPGHRDCSEAGSGRFQTLQAAVGLESQIANWAALCVLLGFQSAKPDRQVFYWLIFKPWVSSDSEADLEVS